MLAYIAKNEYVFISVPKNLLWVSAMPSKSNFRLSHGGAFSIMYQRTTSAPYFESVSNGLTTLPLLFDILLPLLSSTNPFEITVLKATPLLFTFLLTALISSL